MNKPGNEPPIRLAPLDAAWYAAEYPDVALSGLGPAEHYARYGARLGRPPAPVGKPPWQPAGLKARYAASVFHARIADLIENSGNRAFEKQVARSEKRLRHLRFHRSETQVSVIMPTRDRAQVIMQAITSVLEQTHPHWELLVCDDGSRDATRHLVRNFSDPRIEHVALEHGGAARARNHGLCRARGEIIAYLDSDNVWHPRYLERILACYDRRPGVCAARTGYVDATIRKVGDKINRHLLTPYSYDTLSTANFIDLNSFSHRRILHELFGGFDESLVRLQDWDLLVKYLFHLDPASIDLLLTLYRRNAAWNQISDREEGYEQCQHAVAAAVRKYYDQGVSPRFSTRAPSATVLSWDVSRNHFSKAYNLSEAAADGRQVTLVGFRFFEDSIFPPYAGARPAFSMKIFAGGRFPAWMGEMERALDALDGDLLYAVKPRLPSLGLALLANHRTGRPVVLEVNDLESAVISLRGEPLEPLAPEEADPSDPALLDPCANLWSRILESLAPDIPVRVTHNRPLDARFGAGAFFIRNPKDERWFDPDLYDREAIRSELGIAPGEQVVLFSGLLRDHKGVLELLELTRGPGGGRRRLLFVASRHSAELDHVRGLAHPRVNVLPAMDRNAVARVTAAADAVVLWLDPRFPASRYQMPYKLTDALAMRVPVIANASGDLAVLGRQGVLRLVGFGDIPGLRTELGDFRANPEAARAMTEAGRRLYLRQLSYAATRANFALVAAAAARRPGILPAAARFAAFFAKFRDARCAGTGGGR